MIWSTLYLACIGLFRPSSTHALTLPLIQDLSITTPSASLLNTTLLVPQITDPVAPPANSENGRLPNPVCKGDLLGFDMKKYSCLQALTTIPVDPEQLTFGDRNRGYNVELPRRFSGREFLLFVNGKLNEFQTDGGACTKADGTCVIDIFHKGGVVSDTASYHLISRAAEKLYGTCVALGAQRTQGGYIRDLGENNGLVVVLSAYRPSVSCYSQKFPVLHTNQLTQKLLSMISVDPVRQRFGPEGEPGVQVVLPVTYRASQNPHSAWSPRLRSTVDVEHRDPVTARWFDVWAGAVAVTVMCTIRGYSGVSALPNGLSVTVDMGLGPVVGNETAVS